MNGTLQYRTEPGFKDYIGVCGKTEQFGDYRSPQYSSRVGRSFAPLVQQRLEGGSARGSASARSMSLGTAREGESARAVFVPTNLRGAWGERPHPNAPTPRPAEDAVLNSYRAPSMDDPRFKTPPMYTTSNKVDYPDPRIKAASGRDFRGLAGKSYFQLG